MINHKKIFLKKIKSTINNNKKQKLTLLALGLRKLNTTVVHIITPQIIGMINKVSHLLLIKNDIK